MVPGLSGIELIRRLRGRAETHQLPVIMLTARGEEGERVRGLATGAFPVMLCERLSTGLPASGLNLGSAVVIFLTPPPIRSQASHSRLTIRSTFVSDAWPAWRRDGQIRRDLTVELVSQLNETLRSKGNVNRTKLHRVVRNLITQATTSKDEYDEKGRLIKEGAGDLSAIIEIFDRLETLMLNSPYRFISATIAA